MQGRSLLTFLIFLSLPFCAQAQEEPFSSELDAPPTVDSSPLSFESAPSPSTEFAQPAAEPTAAEVAPSTSPSAEPDPTSALAPKSATSSSDEFSEFEESGGPAPAKPVPAKPAVAEKIAPTKPANEVKTSEVTPAQETKPVPLPVVPAPTSKSKMAQRPPSHPVEKKTKFYSKKAAPAVQSLGGDEPDFSKEDQLHRTYQKYNSQPTSEVSWEKATSGGKA